MFLSPAGATITIYVLISTTTVTTLLRCLVRQRIVNFFGVDDWLSLASAILFVSWMILCRMGLIYGIGTSQRELTNDEAEVSFLLYWISYWAYGLVITITRISVGFFFLRITIAPTHRLIIYANMSLNVLVGLAFLGVVIFQCDPVSYFWKKVYHDARGHCMSYVIYVKLGFAYSAICAFCDMVFVFFPVVLLRRLQMSWQKKIGVCVILGMASVAGACPLVRMRYLPDLLSNDFLHDTLGVAIWSGIEAGLAITASNLATLRPLYRFIRDRHEKTKPFHRSSTSARAGHETLLEDDDQCIQLTCQTTNSKTTVGQRNSFSQSIT